MSLAPRITDTNKDEVLLGTTSHKLWEQVQVAYLHNVLMRKLLANLQVMTSEAETL